MRYLLPFLLFLSACGGSGGGSGGPAAPPPAAAYLSFVATCPTDVYYPSASYGSIAVLVTNDGPVSAWTRVLVTMDGVPYPSPGVPTLAAGDTFADVVSLSGAVGSNAVHVFVVTSPEFGWSQTFTVATHAAPAG